MIELSPALRFARSVASAWRRDPQFRSLTILVGITLLGGTIFYSLVEGWSVLDAFYCHTGSAGSEEDQGEDAHAR